jgi:hypothetical protein
MFVYGLLTLLLAIFAIYLASLTFNFADETTAYAYYITLVMMALVVFVGPCIIVVLLFEAYGASIKNNIISLPYLHLGERQYKLSQMPIKKTRVNLPGFRRQKLSEEPMWLLRFNGWRLAVVPIDWVNPLEAETTASIQ